MYTYTNSQLMRPNFSAILGLRLPLDINPAKTLNDAAMEICRTAGGATLAAFFVAPSSRSATTSTSSLREIGSWSQPSIMNLA